MFWNILKNDIVRGMFKRKYLYIIATIVIAVLVIATDLSMRRKIGELLNKGDSPRSDYLM